MHAGIKGKWIASQMLCLSDPRRQRTFQAQMRHLAEAVASRNASLVLVNDVPLLQGDALDCTPLASRLGAWCPSVCGRSRAESVAELADAATTLADLANEFPRSVYFTDAHDWLCDGDTCGPYIPGGSYTLGWMGANHLNYEGSFALWPSL